MHSFLPAARYVCREFLLIYIGQFVSSFGSAMTYVVLPFQMYALTHSKLALGLIGVVEFAPMVAMDLIGGALADHFDRRRLIGFVESAMTLCCADLAWNASLLTPPVVVLWIIAGLLAGLGALHRPAMEALMQQVLPVSEMMAAGALNSVRGNFAFIVGPGLAGIIAATGGATAAFAVDGFSYVVSIAMIAMMRPVVGMTLGEEGSRGVHCSKAGGMCADGKISSERISLTSTRRFSACRTCCFQLCRAMGRCFRPASLCGAVAGRHDGGAYIALGIWGAS